jgi:2-C-methyl-D-erythritol 4-phosphate cytidylyltransferase
VPGGSAVDLGVIIAGAGEGRRMDGRGPKLLLEIDGRSVLARVTATFLACEPVGEIVVAVPGSLLDRASAAIRSLPNPRGIPARAIPGGATRQESVARGLESLGRDLPYVGVHDAARVLVTAPLVLRVLAAARAVGAAIPALPMRDTIKEVEGGRVARSLPRERLWGAQTPQIFARDILARAHARARETGAAATDDALLAEALGAPIAVVPGEPANLKMTEPTDVILLEALLRAGGGGDA